MSVPIQDVLALLPELFPGVQPISLDRIRPYPDNPGPPVTEDQVQELTVPILEDGLVNPLKLRPDPAGPLVPGLSPHPDTPRLKADGTPWKVEDFNWMILSGERRWRAFHKLHGEGWVWQGGASVGHQPSYRLAQLEGAGEAFIPAHILNPTGEEAVIITHTDNDVRDRGWFADHQSIEALVKANPSLTQGRVAAGLKMDRSRINEALQLLPLLNPEARALICGNSTIQNKGKKGISESAVLWLSELGPGSGLKRGVKAAGAEAQKLWPYPAIPPETQDLVCRTLAVAIDQKMTQAKVKALVLWVKEGNRPEEYPTQGVPSSPAVHAKVVVAPGGPVETAPSAPAPTRSPSDAADLHSQVGTAIASHELGKRLHLPAQLMNQLLPPLTRLFHRARGLFTGLGIQNPLLATVFTVLLFLFVGNALISLTGRLMNGLWNGALQVALARGANSTPAPDSQVLQESQFVKTFLEKAFTPDPGDIFQWIDYVRDNLTPGAKKSFDQNFYPLQKFNQIVDDYLRQTFQLTQPVTCLSQGPEGDLFQAQGLLTTKGGSKNPNLNPTTLLKTFRVEVLRSPHGKFYVGAVGL